MGRVSFDESGGATDESDVVKRALSAPLGTEHLAVNHYRIPSGAGLPGGLHAHVDQEEIFVVLSGVAVFETYVPAAGAVATGTARTSGMAAEGGELVVEAGETVRFAPGEFQSGRNGGDDELEVLALGAPRDTEDVRLPVACPECGHSDLRLETGGELTFVCPDCGAERGPRPCPDCGHENLQVTLDDAGAVVTACRDCESTFETPPLEE